MTIKISYYAVPLVLLVIPSLAQAESIHEFFPNCDAATAPAKRTVVVDPSGHTAGALSSITAALQGARPGDVISLMSGNYGDVNIEGDNQDFVTISPSPGQTPNFTSISIGGHSPTSHWRLSGLTISGFSRQPLNGHPLPSHFITVLGSNNIILEHNRLHSQDGKMEWQPLQGPLMSGITARQDTCVTIGANDIHNVFHGIDFGGDQNNGQGQYYLVSDNVIDNFAGDGIEHYGSHVRIKKNRITNGHDVCNNTCVHMDGIQGWNFNHLPVVNSDVTIDSNIIIVETEPNLVLPADTLQGITIFDGKWDGVTVVNNLVITDAWHGISFYGVDRGTIINNTVAPTDPKRPTWIRVTKGKGDPPGTSYNVIIRNNVTPGPVTPREGFPPGVSADHNVAIGDLDDYADAFIKFDTENSIFDMHPAKNSPVKGKGSENDAPSFDVEGSARKAPIDAGAYAGRM